MFQKLGKLSSGNEKIGLFGYNITFSRWKEIWNHNMKSQG